MTRRFVFALVSAVSLLPPAALAQRAGGRALAIEDYYHVQTVGSPQISPDGRWVTFSVASRLEQDNTTRTEIHLAAADGSATPRRILHYGRDVADASWSADNRLRYNADRQQWTVDPANAASVPARVIPLPTGAVASTDGKWIALAKDKVQPRPTTTFASDFERRHDERFKGKTFDWKDFQRDGQPFPAPNLRARPAAQLVVQPTAGGDARVL